MSPQLVLYRRNGSCAMVPHILLRHLQLPFSAVPMKLGLDYNEPEEGYNISRDEYLRLNAAGYVPTLTVDGSPVTEMPAILTYIATQGNATHLLGEGAMERSRVISWLAWLSGTLHGTGYGALWRPKRFVADHTEMHETVKENGLKVIQKSNGRIEEKIVGPYALGDRVTVVDFYMYIFWRWGNMIGLNLREKYPKFGRIAAEIESLEATKATVVEEKEKFYSK